MSLETSPTQDQTRLEDVVLTVTDAALEKVLEIRAGEDDPAALCLRVEVTGVNGVDYLYDLAFEDQAENLPDDVVYRQGELTVAVPADSVERLRGAVLDLPSSPGQGGLVIRNPNRPNPLVGADLELTGDIADKVQVLLAEAINPGLAAHGGFASLVGVDDDRVFLTMGGGCQGCSLSQATMVQGIATAIKEAIPEVREVVDATDHTAGENPFYT
ncbi:MAG: NifU family protein [Acidimicrobiales bacterium]|jgi:Fe/S biogenesis protein NfuA|nr:NifU family protein [Acidimicrobiales bacterium]